MDIQTQYKNYKNLVKQEKKAKRKFNNLRYSICGEDKTDTVSCLRWNLNKWTTISELSKCPNFDNSMTHLSGCQGCPVASTRYHYEVCKEEYKRAHDMLVAAKQELYRNIKHALSEMFKGR